MRRATPDPVAPGQESVWDYPRPPRLESVDRRVRVEADGLVIADSTRVFRVLETSHPPTYYVNPLDADLDRLRRAGGSTYCEWKGMASYFDIVGEQRVIERAAWWYANPTSDFEPLTQHLAFYPALVDCYVDDERVTPQPGRFYGGWVTSDVVGPFKGEPGTEGW